MFATSDVTAIFWRIVISLMISQDCALFQSNKLIQINDRDTIVIVGPGASMKKYEGELWRLREVATIITLPTALWWTHTVQRLWPDLVVVVDGDQSQPQLMRSADYHGPIIASTTAHPILGKENDVYWFSALAGNGAPKPEDNEFYWYDVPLMGMDGDINWQYRSLGCSTNMAVLIAMDLRARGVSSAKRIVLLGCDSSSWGGYRRCPPSHISQEFPSVGDMRWWVEWEDRLTNPQMISYKMTLMMYWMHTHAPIYTLSDGIMHEFPSVTIDDVVAGNYPDYPTKKQIIDRVDTFRAYFADHFPVEERAHAAARDGAGTEPGIDCDGEVPWQRKMADMSTERQILDGPQAVKGDVRDWPTPYVCDDCGGLIPEEVTPEGKCRHCGKEALPMDEDPTPWEAPVGPGPSKDPMPWDGR